MSARTNQERAREWAQHMRHVADSQMLPAGPNPDADLLDALADEVDRLRKFAELVLFCDSYGCENGPGACLHHDAAAVLRPPTPEGGVDA